jgi:hypothetical protein
LTKPDPARSEIERLAAEYRRLKADGGLDEAASLLVFDVTQFVFERLGGLTADQRRQALIASRGKVADALKNLAAPDDAISAFDRISRRSTPFLAHFETWKGATHLKGKTLDQACGQINKFALAVPTATLEGLTGGMVQKWIEGLLHPAPGDGINPKTVNSYFASIRNYWEWLQSHDHAPEGARPFWNRKVNATRPSPSKQAMTASVSSQSMSSGFGRQPKGNMISRWPTRSSSPRSLVRGGKGFARSRPLRSAPIQRRRFRSFI